MINRLLHSSTLYTEAIVEYLEIQTALSFVYTNLNLILHIKCHHECSIAPAKIGNEQNQSKNYKKFKNRF